VRSAHRPSPGNHLHQTRRSPIKGGLLAVARRPLRRQRRRQERRRRQVGRDRLHARARAARILLLLLLLLLPLRYRGGRGRRGRDGSAGAATVGIWDARAGEADGVRAFAAALGRHTDATGDERAPASQRGGDGCVPRWRARGGSYQYAGGCDVDLCNANAAGIAF
jgi:hypothetical protein